MLNLTPTVFIIDPDAQLRASLEATVRRAGLSSKAFASVGALLAHPPVLGPSCLVLEVAVFDLIGLDALQRIGAERPDMPVVVVTAETDIAMTVRAMKAGAVEFLLKPRTNKELLPAIESAIERSSTILGRQAELSELRSRYDSLSARERDVMARVVAGDLNKQAGATLGISEITVKAHRGRAMRKMGAESLAELVTMAMRLDLSSAPSISRVASLSPYNARFSTLRTGDTPARAVAGVR
jgi:FixJ family two-component response regulator